VRVSTLLSGRAVGCGPGPSRYLNGVAHGRGFPYCRALVGHRGCVNAIAFSSGDSRLLATGSDDRRVLLWRTGDPRRAGPPVQTLIGHSSNVFSTQWTPDARHVFSTGNDARVLRFDVERQDFIDEYAHEDAVHKVSFHPDDPHVFISASHDFTLKLWDLRAGRESRGSIAGLDPFTCVAFCPTDGNRFLSCDASSVCLWDLRKSFAADGGLSLEAARQAKQRVLRHYMAICRHHSGVMFLPEISGAAFNAAGTHFVCSVWKAVPLVYSVDCETPLVACHAEGYCNKVTQKSAAFGGSADEYVLCGSDDWGVYIWHLGDAGVEAEDTDHRRRLSLGRRRSAVPSSGVRTHCALPPVRRVQTNAQYAVGAPLHVLRGHQSIVNNVDWGGPEPLIASAGVERDVRLWSPWPLAAGDSGPGPLRVPRREFSSVQMSVLEEMVAFDSDGPSDQQSESNTFELFDYYTSRMESDGHSTGDRSGGLPTAAAGATFLLPSDHSDVDWDSWRTDSDWDCGGSAAQHPAEPHYVRFFSSDNDDDGEDHESGPSDSNEANPDRGAASSSPRAALALSFGPAALRPHLVGPAGGEASDPSHDSGDPEARATAQKKKRFTRTVVVPRRSRQYRRKVSVSPDHGPKPAGAPPTAARPAGALDAGAFEGALCPKWDADPTLSEDRTPAAAARDDGCEDDTALRKRPRSTGDSPDSAIRPTKRPD